MKKPRALIRRRSAASNGLSPTSCGRRIYSRLCCGARTGGCTWWPFWMTTAASWSATACPPLYRLRAQPWHHRFESRRRAPANPAVRRAERTSQPVIRRAACAPDNSAVAPITQPASAVMEAASVCRDSRDTAAPSRGTGAQETLAQPMRAGTMQAAAGSADAVPDEQRQTESVHRERPHTSWLRSPITPLISFLKAAKIMR